MVKKGKQGNSIGGKVPRNRMTTAQFAKKVGVSVDTIKRWRKLGVLKPATSMQVGTTTVGLYTERQVERGRALKRGTGPLSQRGNSS